MANPIKVFTADDMLEFAISVYNEIADLPGHEPTPLDLVDWCLKKNKPSGVIESLKNLYKKNDLNL